MITYNIMEKNCLIVMAVVLAVGFLLGILGIMVKLAIVGLAGYATSRFLKDGWYWWKKEES